MTYDTAKIRAFLIDQFSDGELSDLCFDHFQEVYTRIEGMDKIGKIRQLLDYCRRNAAFPHLLDILEQLRPVPYTQTFPPPIKEPDPTPVMLNEVREVKHPDGGSPTEADGILRSADYAQNDGGLRKWLAILRGVPMPVWGVVAMVLLAWVAYSGLSGGNPEVTPTTELAQNSPAATQPVPSVATPTITLTATNLPATSTSTSPATSTFTVTPTSSSTPPPLSPTPAPMATLNPPANAQLGDTWTRPTDGMVMVYVPAGTFLMGSTQAQIDTALAECKEILGDCADDIFDDEKPQHEVALDGFWIDRTEVTNAHYALCVQGGVCETSAYEGDNRFNGDNYPVVGVSWIGADTYCQWVEGSLPTEAQWEYVARGPENRIYPWGNAFDGSLLNFCDTRCTQDWKNTGADDRYEFTAPVGAYPHGDSWVGALDIAGNVSEWVQDWYQENYYSASLIENPLGPGEDEGYIVKGLRGGSWSNMQPFVRTAFRSRDFLYPPNDRNDRIGFRCVVRPGN